MERAARIWFCLLLAALAGVLWWCPLFPSQDGPAHVYNASLLRAQIDDPYEWNRGLTTNWTAHLLLAALLGALSPEQADKTVAILALLFCAGAAAYCLRRTAWLLPYAIPLAVNGLLFCGFYSFVFGLGLMFLLLGGARPRWLLLALCWLSHPFCWAGAVAGLLAMDWPRWKRLALEASPGAVCAAAYTGKAVGGMTPPPLLAGQWSGFFFGENPFAAVHAGYALPAAALMAVLCALAGWAWRRGGRERMLALPAAAMWALWPLAPKETLAGGLLPRRVLLLALIYTLVWVARQTWSERAAARMFCGGAVLATSAAGVVAWQVVAIQPALAEYRTMRASGRTVGLRYSLEAGAPGMMRGVDLFLHAADWLVLRDGGLDGDNYEARSATFPLRYRRAPVAGLLNTSAAPPRVQFEEASLPDTILLWGYPADHPLRRELARWFESAGRTAPRGVGEMWKLKATAR